VTSDDGVVEIAHEALARAWPRLRGWLEDDVEGQRIMHHLSATADSWDALGRPPSELYRGVRLAQAVEWDERPHPEMTATERDFLAASRMLAEAEERAAAETARHQARMIRRLRLVLGGALVLLLAALAAGGVAVRQQGIARDNARAAVSAQTGSDARRAGARALSVDDIDTSLLLAVAGVRLDDSDATRENLQDALTKRSQLVESTPREGAGVSGMELTSDGERLAVYDLEGRVDLFDPSDWRRLATFTPPAAPDSRAFVAPMAFAPDGETLAVGMPLLVPDSVRLLDGRTLEPTGTRLPGLHGEAAAVQDRPVDLAWSADGSTLAVLAQRLYVKPETGGFRHWETDDYHLLVWRMDPAPRLVVRRVIPGRPETSDEQTVLDLSDDGSTVWTSEPLTAYDATTGAVQLRTAHHTFEMDLSADSALLAVTPTRDAKEIQLVDALTGDVERTLRGHTNDVLALELSPDGRLLASTSYDGEGIVWDTRRGTILEALALGETAVMGLEFSSDGSRLYTAGADASIRSWDLDGSARFLARTRGPGEFGYGSLFVSPDGAHTAHAAGGSLRFRDTTTGKAVRAREACCYGGAFSPDGTLFVGGEGQLLQIWDPRTGALVRDNRAHPWARDILELAWTRDGSRILLTDVTGHLGWVDATTLEEVGSVRVAPAAGYTQPGPNNHTGFALVTDVPAEVANSFLYGGTMSRWVLADLETGEVTGGETGFKSFSLAISPDQQRLAIGGVHGEVALVDVESGELVRPAVVAHADVTLWWTAWSADGSRFATAGWDGSVVLWDGRTGLPLGSIVMPEETLMNLAFLPDGETLLLAPYTDSLYLWDTSGDHAVEFACRASAGDLDEAEWATWFGNRPYQETCPEP
jgi:WD40 repeat protein